ncbi:sensor histidine kinase [Azohydromonas australica]|uniref:sensor histidine kinase n=1 Tax=Azohydromonas australica TaxID=364039 RepID=UPI000490E6FD|nr:sensor histidine kinase [Azohydromonas australica]
MSIPAAPDAPAARRAPGLRTLLTLLTFVLSALGAGGLVALRSEQIDREARAAAGELNLQQAVGVAAAIDTDLGRFGSELLAQAQLVEESGALRQPVLLQALMNGLQAQPSHAWAGVTDAHGKVLAASAGRLVGMNVAGREWWGAAQDRLHYGDVHEAELLQRLLPALQAGEPWRFIDLSAPLREDGQLAGVVAVHLSWPWLRERIELFARAIPTRDAQLFITGSDGRQRLGPVGALGDALPLHVLAEEVPRGWRVQRWPDGRDYVTAWATSPGSTPFAGFGWVTLVRTPLQALELAHAGLHHGVWTAAVLTVLLATALAWTLSTYFLRLLARFVERVHRIAEGAEVPPPSRRLPAELARIDEVLQALMGRLHGQALRAGEARDVFLAQMNHEVRTPLNAVIGLSRLLGQMELPDKALRYVREIEQAGQRLLALATGALERSHRTDGGARLRHEVFELPALLDAAREAVEPEARRKRLGLKLDLAPELPPRLRGDAFQLRRLLLGLLAHAVRVTDHGDVSLRVRHVPLAAGQQQLLLQLEVPAAGGLAADNPAAQADGPVPRAHGAFEQGLARVRRLARLLGGTLAVEDEPGRGAVLQVSLPFDAAA